ncbi:MAG TPA: hypothetical protein VMH00_01130 [Candidatus Limnocylindrales bacterium]|nr:hypothetical protein [Candidatus Limnocylindrales bacterium]
MPKPEAEVFLNIPYDAKFERLFRAYICGTSAFGLVPRATLEIPGGARRLDRILELIKSCQFAIHDLSRVELDRTPPCTPRFNMPFELGLSVAHERVSKRGRHEWFVCESQNFRLAKSLSDLNGTDPYIHGGTLNGLFAQLRNMFVRRDRQPSIQQMWTIYREMSRTLPLILHEAGQAPLYSARVFKDLCVLASASADRVVV